LPFQIMHGMSHCEMYPIEFNPQELG